MISMLYARMSSVRVIVIWQNDNGMPSDDGGICLHWTCKCRLVQLVERQTMCQTWAGGFGVAVPFCSSVLLIDCPPAHSSYWELMSGIT